MIYIVGVVLQVAASSVGLLAAGKAVAGLEVGFLSAVVITYVSESMYPSLSCIFVLEASKCSDEMNDQSGEDSEQSL